MSNNNLVISQEDIDKLIDLYYKQPRVLYEHLFASYNQLVEEIVPYSLVQEANHFYQNVIENNIYLHGFKCSNIRIKPPTFDNDNEIKFPSDARKNHLNYFATIVCDVVQVLEKVDILTGDKTIKEIGEVEKELAIGNIPIMVKSKYCSTQIKKDLHGECKYDPGGYFIVNGQEKVVMSIEKMVDNKALVFTKKETSFPEGFIHTAQINSRKNDWADNLQIVTIKNRKENDISITTSSLVDVPIFIMFRALGVESDQDIISKITYDITDVKMINLLRSSMEHSMDDLGNHIKTREEAVEYLASKLRKNRMISQTDEELAKIQRKMMLEKILRQDFLPHLGEDIPKKICYLGHMINKQLNVWLGRNDADDRDALQNKRIETPGILIGQLFRQNWKKMLNEIGKLFAKKNQSDENPINVLNQIKPAIIEQGIKTALATGIWGMNKTKKGVAQSLQRLSWVQAISYLRRVMAPSLDSSTSKVTSIRQAQNLQVQFLCCAETPEGQKIGIVKSLAMMSSISHQNTFQDEVVKAVLKTTKIKHPADIDPLQMKSHTKIFMNGDWVGVCKVAETNEIYELLKSKRRNGVIDKYTSICLDYTKREIKIFYDGGRLIRPLLMVNNNKLAITKEVLEDVDKELLSKDFAKGWRRLLAKFTNLVEYEDVESSNYIMCADRFYRLNEVEENRNRKVEYNETSKINRYGDYRWIKYTHSDFHSWTQLGIIAGNIPFSNHNHSGRNIIHFSQAKQAISVYLTSYKDRMDISQILFYPQVPIVTTKTMEYNHCLDLPYGENAIVAIASYNGYNQEDSMVFNQSAIDRGIFRADTLKKYHSEIDKNPSTNQDDIFTKPDKNKVADMKQGNYGKLGEKGFAPEETEITNEDFIIGKVSPIQPTGDSNKVYKDSSEIFKSNVDGVIDRVHTGIYNAEGYEMYNVRVRMERVPVIGDKFCQKGESQVLTNKGWIQLKDININEHKVVTFDKEEKLTYINPSEKFEFDHDGDMYVYNNKHVEIECTPNHKLYTKKRHSNKFELIKASDIKGKMTRMKNNIDNNYPDVKEFKIGDKNFEMNEWLKLLGMYISDGNVTDNYIFFSCVKERKIKYCKEFLTKLSIEHTYNNDKYRIKSEDIARHFNELGKGAINKRLPEYVWNLSQNQSRILMEALLEGDGHTFADGFSRYGTISTGLADDISRLCLHCGWSGHIKLAEKAGKISSGKRNLGTRAGSEVTIEQKNDYYKISIIRKHNEPWINKKDNDSNEEKYEKFKGKVYCIEVPESHVYYMRQTDLSPPIWIGNSNRHG